MDRIKAFRTGDPFSDPWTSHQPKPASDPKSSTNLEPRQLEGPIVDRFAQNEARMTAIEATMQNLQLTQEAAQKSTATRFEQLDLRMHQQEVTTKQGFDHLHSEQQGLQQCIADAMARQDTRLANSLDELKALILQQRGTKRSADPPAVSESDIEDDQSE